ncbi:uncharacterized protein FOMMEDRAFT_159334 [Fomitiporia mediterranea MF3/22]|uniref:uncharacterized protein n=1 Tax=Fomitiporia mediterranea (strain MF3/22) TaxID=694068 RepID=UPI0004407330|nr:uncharacterized protein FOMMEDRAFT_159334 [Fomitiporia mediterranea MF3/22]EJD00588.1 hypothetical protein FOMMEDRAFT_159334 [Fomitiporia mediterranea MF3/22]
MHLLSSLLHLLPLPSPPTLCPQHYVVASVLPSPVLCLQVPYKLALCLQQLDKKHRCTRVALSPVVMSVLSPRTPSPPGLDVKLRAIDDEHALATVPTYDHSHGTALSSTPYALSFPTHHPMLVITLDGSTPHWPPLAPPEPSPSTPSTSPSPFGPERPRDTPLQSITTTQFTAPPIVRHNQSIQRARTDTASSTAQISSFNTSDLNSSAPLILATRFAPQPPKLAQPHNSHAHAIQLAGTERRPK